MTTIIPWHAAWGTSLMHIYAYIMQAVPNRLHCSNARCQHSNVNMHVEPRQRTCTCVSAPKARLGRAQQVISIGRQPCSCNFCVHVGVTTMFMPELGWQTCSCHYCIHARTWLPTTQFLPELHADCRHGVCIKEAWSGGLQTCCSQSLTTSSPTKLCPALCNAFAFWSSRWTTRLPTLTTCAAAAAARTQT